MKSNTLVIGLGKSGIAAAKLLNAEGIKVTILEKRQTKDLETIAQSLRNDGIEVKLNQPLELSSFNPWLPDLKTVITSPGIHGKIALLSNLEI